MKFNAVAEWWDEYIACVPCSPLLVYGTADNFAL